MKIKTNVKAGFEPNKTGSNHNQAAVRSLQVKIDRSKREMIEENVRSLYGDAHIAPCPFTSAEISELDETGELLIYLPANLSVSQLCDKFGIKANINFDIEQMIRNVMVKENQWFIASANNTPELIYRSAQAAKRIYEDEGLHGMDVRRYLAFAGTFKQQFGSLPDQSYWSFLLSGSYDRSGVSIIGFDVHGILNHHGWMKNFKAKFTGSRYIVIAPRLEITRDTETISRAYRGRLGDVGQEADMD